MENIAYNLANLSWWFTVFFGAILTGLISGFLQKRIERLIGGLSSSLHIWKEEKEKERRVIIEALVNNETYLSIALFRFILSYLSFAIVIMICMVSLIMLTMVPEYQQTHELQDRTYLFAKIMLTIMVVFIIPFSFKMTSKVSIVSEAIKQFRIKHDLPKLP